jgi:hypothetical protein
MTDSLMNDNHGGISAVASHAPAHEFRQSDKFDALDATPKVRGGNEPRADSERLLKPPKGLRLPSQANKSPCRGDHARARARSVGCGVVDQ